MDTQKEGTVLVKTVINGSVAEEPNANPSEVSRITELARHAELDSEWNIERLVNMGVATRNYIAVHGVKDLNALKECFLAPALHNELRLPLGDENHKQLFIPRFGISCIEGGF